MRMEQLSLTVHIRTHIGIDTMCDDELEGRVLRDAALTREYSFNALKQVASGAFVGNSLRDKHV